MKKYIMNERKNGQKERETAKWICERKQEIILKERKNAKSLKHWMKKRKRNKKKKKKGSQKALENNLD